jgi:hypothetical protein
MMLSYSGLEVNEGRLRSRLESCASAALRGGGL